MPLSLGTAHETHLIHATHETKPGLRDRIGAVDRARSAQSEQFAPAHDRHRAFPVDQRLALGWPKWPSASPKQPRSMVSLPTLAQVAELGPGVLERRCAVVEDVSGLIRRLPAPGGDLGGMHAAARTPLALPLPLVLRGRPWLWPSRNGSCATASCLLLRSIGSHAVAMEQSIHPSGPGFVSEEARPPQKPTNPFEGKDDRASDPDHHP